MTNWLDVDEVRAYIRRLSITDTAESLARTRAAQEIICAIAALPEPREHTHLHPDWCRDEACKSYRLRRIWLVARAVVGEET